MKDQKDSKREYDPSLQIELLRNKSNKIAPSIYKIHALYLEILRKVLPDQIKSSIFTLLTEHTKNRAKLPPIEIRNKFQLKIEKIILDNIPLLTVEHLIHLANTLEEEKINKLNHARAEMINILNKKGADKIESESLSNQSINLGISPPLEDQSILNNSWSENTDSSFTFSIDDNYIDTNLVADTNLPENDLLNEVISDESKDDNLASSYKEKEAIDIFQSFFVMQDEADANRNGKELEGEAKINDEDSYKSRNNKFLPDSPSGLLEWFESIDFALVRRLRNLSHGINIELLRHGLVNTLVPISILDSIIDGQVTTISSASNIVTLKLPMNAGVTSDGIDIECILLRTSDLEFDHSHLRKSKLHIKQYRNEIIRMVKQQRYWQSRSLADDLRQQWSPSTQNNRKENLLT